MNSMFDGYAASAFSAVSDLMGISAIWLTPDGAEMEGKVLFKDPSEPVFIGEAEKYEYRIGAATIEYHAGTFGGLKKLADAGNRPLVRIGEKCYCVLEVTTKFDGQTIVAHLEQCEANEPWITKNTKI